MAKEVICGIVETPSGREFEAQCELEPCFKGGRETSKGALVVPKEHLEEFAMNPKGFHFKAESGEAFETRAGLYAKAGGDCIWEGRISLARVQ
ncbi:MAG: hypothetical protein JXQ91_05100 [Vannielia sp.]|uniref:hypothetical protein n=1 Tax=Rhodobacterales TaxID=204455 RepID=UPI00209412A6|nr:hypothetical protein [Oceanicola sp. 502str15]MCO6381655.1 hypothetical protein [Oceanicola sp. 502str15]